MKRLRFLLPGYVVAIIMILIAPLVQALEVDREVSPRLTLGGRLIATPFYATTKGAPGIRDGNQSQVDISDSGLLFRFDKRIYNNKAVAGAIVGFTKPDQDDDLKDDVYFHHLYGFLQSQRFQVVLGRTRLRNTLLEFPTLRDDDLIDYTHVPNASSYANNDQYQIFGTQMAFDWYLDNRNNAISVWLSGRMETDLAGKPLQEFNLNTFGFGWNYQVSEDMQYVKRLRQAGVYLETQKIDVNTGDNSMNAIIAGAEWNLNLNPPKSWSVALQAIYNEGIDGATIATHIGRARSKYRAVTMALRYTSRPKLLTRSQAAITFGYKDFSEFSNASQYSIAPSYVYRLGQGIDLVTQYIYTKRDSALAVATGTEREHVLQAGIVFSFDKRFDDNIGKRDSILNIEHGYIR
ncbi:MAG: hypothetical protein BMS9Abin11_0958 [Gammaproteobacteria bacterium]|nr:MAG: hypothetical protein BMS9Abin11_0958 [Gammaproteobacteria bacterium]